MMSLSGPIAASRLFEAGSFEHWLSRLAVRTCYDFLRGHRRADVSLSTLTADQAGSIERSPENQTPNFVMRRTGENHEGAGLGAAQLSPDNRLVVTFMHLENRSVREAADLLGWSTVNVKVRCHRARQKLRTLLLQE